MLRDTSHPTDQELLMAADGELSTRHAARIRGHLASCWGCRARTAEIESSIADFMRTHGEMLDPKLPPMAASRAQLKARLAELETGQYLSAWRRFFRQFTPAMQAAVCLCVVLAAAVAGRHFLRRSAEPAPASPVASSRLEIVPNPSLTPGASRRVAVSEVCSMEHEEVVRGVSERLRRQVFQEYGIVNADASDYEIDYLITPGLGGAEDIRNLWPEPYNAPMWNARVKDALEEHLHQLVCSGKLDLATAQHDIASDWIVAYKKYFHTDEPLSSETNGGPLLGRSISPFGQRLPVDQRLTKASRVRVHVAKLNSRYLFNRTSNG